MMWQLEQAGTIGKQIYFDGQQMQQRQSTYYFTIYKQQTFPLLQT